MNPKSAVPHIQSRLLLPGSSERALRLGRGFYKPRGGWRRRAGTGPPGPVRRCQSVVVTSSRTANFAAAMAWQRR